MKIYLCSEDLAKQINITSDSNSFGHKKRTFEKGVFLWPEHFHKTSLLPQAFLAQKKNQEIETLIIIDRIINREGTIKIKGHINRSGTSFLRTETPHKERPTFPDMSKIYKNKSGETVITVGPERFVENNKQKTKTISEALAPIATLWSYVGVSLQAYGCGKKITSPIKLIEGISKLG